MLLTQHAFQMFIQKLQDFIRSLDIVFLLVKAMSFIRKNHIHQP